MFIIYQNPVDDMPRARKVSSYREAAEVIITLQKIGCDPEAMSDIDMAKQTSLPLLVSPWSPKFLTNPSDNVVDMKDHPEYEHTIVI